MKYMDVCHARLPKRHAHGAKLQCRDKVRKDLMQFNIDEESARQRVLENCLQGKPHFIHRGKTERGEKLTQYVEIPLQLMA